MAENLQTIVNKHTTELGTLHTTLDTITTNVSDLQTTVNAIHTNMTALQHTVNRIRSDMQNGVNIGYLDAKARNRAAKLEDEVVWPPPVPNNVFGISNWISINNVTDAHLKEICTHYDLDIPDGTPTLAIAFTLQAFLRGVL